MVKQPIPKEQVEFVPHGTMDKLNEVYEESQQKIADLEFELECRPDPEGCPDNQVEDDFFFTMECLIVRLGYPRFEQVLDRTMAKVRKYYD